MESLRATDVRAILRFVDDSYAVAPRQSFRMHAISRLRTLVPSDMTAWVETHAGKPEVEVVASPRDPLPDGPRRFARVRDKHPVLAHFERSRRGGAAKLSDFVSRSRYHRLTIYQEFFRPAGVEHQISIALPSRGPRLIRITLNRAHGDFTERDRLVLDLLRPHIAEAHRNAEALGSVDPEYGDLEQIADAVDVGMIVIRDVRRVTHANRRATELLSAYFGEHALRRARLPEPLSAWLATHRRSCAKLGRALSREPLVISGDGNQLEIRLLSSTDRHVLVLRERSMRITPASLEALGLTERQAEVLAWLARGKSNFEIGSILSISPNTVARHVEAIFAKLGVRSRTAASAAAFAHVSSL